MNDEAQTPEKVLSDILVDIGWNNTTPEKVWGLLQVWGTVKYNFVFLDPVAY